MMKTVLRILKSRTRYVNNVQMCKYENVQMELGN